MTSWSRCGSCSVDTGWSSSAVPLRWTTARPQPIVIGFGVAAATIGAMYGFGSAGLGHLVRLTWTAILLGAAFLAAGNFVSASVRQPGTAASLAIGIWVIAVVMLDVALLGAVVADDGGVALTVLMIHGDGMSRILLINEGMNDQQTGRVMQRGPPPPRARLIPGMATKSR